MRFVVHHLCILHHTMYRLIEPALTKARIYVVKATTTLSSVVSAHLLMLACRFRNSILYNPPDAATLLPRPSEPSMNLTTPKPFTPRHSPYLLQSVTPQIKASPPPSFPPPPQQAQQHKHHPASHHDTSPTDTPSAPPSQTGHPSSHPALLSSPPRLSPSL